MTKREAERRAQQRAAAGNERRGWVRAKAAAPAPASDVEPAPPAREQPLPEKARPPPNKQLLDYADLRALGVPWSRSRLYSVMRAGRFPRPVATGPNWYDKKLWRRRDYENWLRKLPYAFTNAAE
jgi:predicted DNA-binding transcriptional regulator AlpA